MGSPFFVVREYRVAHFREARFTLTLLSEGFANLSRARTVKDVPLEAVILLRHILAATAALFSREGGSPVWVPAFAGKHAIRVRPVLPL